MFKFKLKTNDNHIIQFSFTVFDKVLISILLIIYFLVPIIYFDKFVMYGFKGWFILIGSVYILISLGIIYYMKKEVNHLKASIREKCKLIKFDFINGEKYIGVFQIDSNLINSINSVDGSDLIVGTFYDVFVARGQCIVIEGSRWKILEQN